MDGGSRESTVIIGNTNSPPRKETEKVGDPKLEQHDNMISSFNMSSFKVEAQSVHYDEYY